MSLSTLTSASTPIGSTTKSHRKSLPTWLLPVGLVAGFAILFVLLFGEKIHSAIPVKTAPVITLRAEGKNERGIGVPPVSEESNTSTVHNPNPQPNTLPPITSALLFQASGWIEPDPYTIRVPALINGVVNQVHVLEGDTVKKGQLLATLISADTQLDLKQAERKLDTLNAEITAHCAMIPVVEAEIAAAEKSVVAQKKIVAEFQDIAQRFKNLKSGSISEKERIQATLQYERELALLAEAEAAIPGLEAKIEQIEFQRIAKENTLREAENDRDRAKLAFDRTTIKSPSAGIILRLHAAPGKKRMSNMDDPDSSTIVELFNPKKLQARIDVPLNEAAGLAIGQPVELLSDFLPDLTLRGEVTRITGEADLQRNTLQVKVQILNPDPRLRPEMLVRAKFYPRRVGVTPASSSSLSPSKSQSIKNSRFTLFAPEAALINLTKTTATAWVVSPENTADLRQLTLGTAEKDHHREVTKGLLSGEQLILPPHEKLKQGTRIKITNSTER